MSGAGSSRGAAIAGETPRSYGAHRQQVLADSVPLTAMVVLALIAFYAGVDLYRAPNPWQALTYALELAVPFGALLLVRRAFPRHAEAITLSADLLFTALIAFRLLLPTTSVSGTALFLSLKVLATAALWPWHPLTQAVSAAVSMLLYSLALAASDRVLDRSHEMIGPLIAAVLSCVGATIADRTRRDLWQRSVALADSDRRTRQALAAERLLGAVAREISVLTDLRGTLDRVNALTAAALGCDYSMTYLVDRGRGGIAAAATNCTDPPIRDRLLSLRAPLDAPLVRELIAGRPVIINDPGAQPWLPVERLYGVRRLALTPIVVKGEVLGALSVTRIVTDSPFDDRQVALLSAIAAQAAIAIDNARLFDGLARSEARYRDLFERATDLILVVDEDGGIRFANQAALDRIGLAADGLATQRWHELVSIESRRLIERHMAMARRRGGDSDRAVVIEATPPGRPGAVLEVRARCLEGAGRPRVYHCIARDITERRRQERETAQLLRRLQEANRLQGEFVANMSHELRTPLNVIIGYADLLGDELGGDAGGDAGIFLRRIAGAGRALHRLVESVLEYARLDRGRQVLIPRRFPATDLLRELGELGHDVRGSSPIHVQVQAQADLLFHTDYDRLYSALSNLLLNAIKFTTAGSVELAVRRCGAHAEFLVRDTGIGIEAEELAHVFEPFRQADGSPTRSFGGVGLGLAIVRRNIELLQGEVAVESQLGVGTSFRVRIPLAIADADAGRAAGAATAA